MDKVRAGEEVTTAGDILERVLESKRLHDELEIHILGVGST